MKNAVFWDVMPCGSCKNVSEEHIASIIRMTRIGLLGTLLAVASNQGTVRIRNNVSSN
jgi:hypothetical protein